MFKIFVNFLEFIISNIEEFIFQNEPVENESLQQIFSIYTLFKLLDQKMNIFASELQHWQQGFYQGASWSGIHVTFKRIHAIMMLLMDDLEKLINIQNLKLCSDEHQLLRHKLRGYIYFSIRDTWNIWTEIIQQNISKTFCNWISYYSDEKNFSNAIKRTIIFPEYSILLPNVKPTSELDDIFQSQWKEELSAIKHFPYVPRWYGYALKFLPEFPPKFPLEVSENTKLIAFKSYTLMVEVPQQEQMMTDIITSIAKSVLNFHQSVNHFKHILETAMQNRMNLCF